MSIHFLVHRWESSCCVSRRGGGGASFVRTLISFMEAPSSWANHFPKTPLANSMTLRGRISIHKEFGGKHKH